MSKLVWKINNISESCHPSLRFQLLCYAVIKRVCYITLLNFNT